jgi:hypothetical protein
MSLGENPLISCVNIELLVKACVAIAGGHHTIDTIYSMYAFPDVQIVSIRGVACPSKCSPFWQFVSAFRFA